MTDIMTVFNWTSLGLLLASSVLLVIVFSKYFKGMKTPPFWIFFLSGFYMLIIQELAITYLGGTEFFLLLQGTLKLGANALIFLGVWHLYKQYKK
jgi:hypothetical protein